MLATLGFLRLEGQLATVLHALHRWLDSWRGMGTIESGMARQGYDLQLTRYGEPGMAGDVPHKRHRTLGRGGLGVGAETAQGAAWGSLTQRDTGGDCHENHKRNELHERGHGAI